MQADLEGLTLRTMCASARQVRAGVAVRTIAFLLGASILAGAPQVAAETLRQAMASAYRNNPRLDAERARLRATDEDVPRALSGYRPRVSGSTDAGLSRVETRPSSASEGDTRPWGYSLTLSQTVFNGFRTTNSVDEAEAQVRAGRQILKSVEQQVLLETVTAYADVVRDGAVVRIREANVNALNRELTVIEARRSAREVTRTDVAQARSRIARALSQQDLARGNLKSSRAAFERAVGYAPSGLMPPRPPKSLLPRTLQEALAIAEKENPTIVTALYRETAERHGVARIRGELLPEVRLEASYGNRNGLTGGTDQQESATITGRLSMPLYEGGETYARVRQAKHKHVARLQEIEQARQETQASVTQAWSRYQTTRARLRADNMAVGSARIALDGVREEERAGQRTVLDLLNAQQELLEAEVQVAQSKREVVVSAYGLLGEMGRLTVEEMALTDRAYDAEVHYEGVRGRWFGLDITHANGHREIIDVGTDADPDWQLDE
jgi:outer membrane protein